jgi:PAS domain S-box-containing protein
VKRTIALDNRRRQAKWVALGLVLEAVLVGADVVYGPLAGVFLLLPLLLAVVAAPPLVGAAGVLATLLAALAPLWSDVEYGTAAFLRVVIVAAGSLLALFTASRRLSDRDRRSLAAVTEVVSASPAGVIGMDLDGRITLLNPSAEAMFGHRAEDVIGREVAEVFVPPEMRDAHRAGLARLRAGGESRVLGKRLQMTALRADGTEFPVGLTITRLSGAGESAFAGYARDITQELRDEATQRVLARTAELLGAATDYEQALREVPQIAVPELADRCSLEMAGEDPPAPMLADRTMVVPLCAARRTIGALVLEADPGRRPFDAADLELAEELGRRAGSALESARLYRERSELARTLAASLRPPAMPPMRGWQAAALYQPADRIDEVGGDFYDVISLEDAWMLVIGDVIGKGPSAAALTSLARYSIRTAATLTGSPASALDHLNEDLHREGQSGVISAACVLLRETAAGAEATIAAAGHPLPILVRGGDAHPIGRPSLLLGVDPGASVCEDTVEIRVGDQLVLYTDGVPDAQGRTERFGEHRLLAALRAFPAASSEELVNNVAAPLDAFQQGPQRDDIALLAVTRLGEHAGADAEGVILPFRSQARG